ncbi:hypothetical protein JD844_009204 [Phrynosoma platyrhinos]|uniref:Uncharacterized protein n=1 Tax=Phrynosoma platyrhinos TaxID=52577 RepID=A0ABQ7TFF7_PHRPL|nr:hypothetical protein JD844_009204 [Phrynosoma platyrhinos]
MPCMIFYDKDLEMRLHKNEERCYEVVDVGEDKFCFCCEEFLPAKCTEKENALKLYPVQSCSAVHLLLKVRSSPNIDCTGNE